MDEFDDTKTATVFFRCSEEFKELIILRAQRARRTLSDWIRVALEDRIIKGDQDENEY